MKLARSIAAIAIFSFTGTILNAQINEHPFDLPKYKDVVDMKNRQLIVLVNPPDPNVVNKYDKKGKMDMAQEYNQIIGNYNENMKYLVQKFWTFNSQEVLYMTWDDMEKMLGDKSKRDKYYIMFCFSEENHKGLDWRLDKNGEEIVGTHTFFGVCFPDDNPLLHFHFLFSGLIPTVVDLTYLISTTNYNFNYVLNHKDITSKKPMVDENAHLLASKTLLLLEKDVSKKVIPDIHTYYPCNFKLVGDSEMMQAVAGGDSTCAYVVREGFADPMNWIVNCKDGAVLGYSEKESGGGFNAVDMGYYKDFFLDIADFCGAGLKK
ncbi:MAG TPA: hypothetical protein VK808_03980 [Bacteroidia bacterium]|nr:hypothetical protein [Bacteroidia bacterium]